MGRRPLLVGLVAAAPLADAAGVHSVSFWLLVAAVPYAAACALDSFGAFLEARGDALRSLQALLWAPALLLLLVAAASRGPALATGTVPRLGVTALAGCLAVIALKAAVAGYAALYRGRAFAAWRATSING